MNKIFGREPARWTGLIGALVIALAAFKNPWVSPGAAAAIVALLSAGVLAWTTRPVAPAVLTGVVTAGVAVAAEYGFHASEAQVAGITGVVLAAASMFAVRDQVDPQETAISHT
jgi:hypothetical protein